ncbi:hypothetical protein B0H19DRAFT_1291449 [Mycena capillaripes]|nr:hypothetical protein B0H19DRAFT_1291449 [Mycena capillaripes]
MARKVKGLETALFPMFLRLLSTLAEFICTSAVLIASRLGESSLDSESGPSQAALLTILKRLGVLDISLRKNSAQSFSSTISPSASGTSQPRKPKPINAFIFYRSVVLRSGRLKTVTDHQNKLSKIIAAEWNAMTPQEKRPFEVLARALALESARATKRGSCIDMGKNSQKRSPYMTISDPCHVNKAKDILPATQSYCLEPPFAAAKVPETTFPAMQLESNPEPCLHQSLTCADIDIAVKDTLPASLCSNKLEPLLADFETMFQAVNLGSPGRNHYLSSSDFSAPVNTIPSENTEKGHNCHIDLNRFASLNVADALKPSVEVKPSPVEEEEEMQWQSMKETFLNMPDDDL